MNLQAFIDNINTQRQRERAETQMTLGKLIAALEAMPESAEVANLNNAHNYRDYYSDLAFEQDKDTRAAADLLAECKATIGQIFEDYKNRDFVMNALTPIWMANYGHYRTKLMALHVGGEIKTTKDN